MRVVMAWHLSIRGADRWGASAGGLRPLAAPLVPPVRVLTSWLLLSLHTSLLTGAREHQLPERLIGWKGETHSVVNTVSEAVREDRRKGPHLWFPLIAPPLPDSPPTPKHLCLPASRRSGPLIGRACPASWRKDRAAAVSLPGSDLLATLPPLSCELP